MLVQIILILIQNAQILSMSFSLFFCLSFAHLIIFINRSKVLQAIDPVVPWLFPSQAVLVTEQLEYL